MQKTKRFSILFSIFLIIGMMGYSGCGSEVEQLIEDVRIAEDTRIGGCGERFSLMGNAKIVSVEYVSSSEVSEGHYVCLNDPVTVLFTWEPDNLNDPNLSNYQDALYRMGPGFDEFGISFYIQDGSTGLKPPKKWVEQAGLIKNTIHRVEAKVAQGGCKPLNFIFLDVNVSEALEMCQR